MPGLGIKPLKDEKTETAVPVKLGEKTIGYLRIGRVLRRSPSKADTGKVSRTLLEHGVPFTTELRNACEPNPLIAPEKYGAIVRLLTFFATQLSHLINQIALEKQNAEPPIVQKARVFGQPPTKFRSDLSSSGRQSMVKSRE